MHEVFGLFDSVRITYYQGRIVKPLRRRFAMESYFNVEKNKKLLACTEIDVTYLRANARQTTYKHLT